MKVSITDITDQEALRIIRDRTFTVQFTRETVETGIKFPSKLEIPSKRRPMAPAVRHKIALAQKRRWAKVKKAK